MRKKTQHLGKNSLSLIHCLTPLVILYGRQRSLVPNLTNFKSFPFIFVNMLR